ncbi:MAG: hypothetical protein K9H26_05775 [Prolixibacteraceae bacterium]|nr:hypothetical protein [Prolixibacteraceae bacterium]
MATVIIDTSTNEAKRLVDYLKTLRFAKVLDENREDAPTYNPEFVDMIKQREKQASVKVDIDNIWK